MRKRNVSPRRLLGFSRIALGLIFVVRTTPLADLLPTPLAHTFGRLLGWPDGGWPMAWGDLVLADSVRKVACVLRTIAAVLFLLGVRARFTGTIAGVLGLVALSQKPCSA